MYGFCTSWEQPDLAAQVVRVDVGRVSRGAGVEGVLAVGLVAFHWAQAVDLICEPLR